MAPQQTWYDGLRTSDDGRFTMRDSNYHKVRASKLTNKLKNTIKKLSLYNSANNSQIASPEKSPDASF